MGKFHWESRPISSIQILWEDDDYVALNKPSGVPVQAPPGIDSLEQQWARFRGQREQLQGRPYVGLPHRLDRPASGVILLGKRKRATRRMCELFECRLVGKLYWVLVEGRVEPASGRWQDYVRKIPDRAHSEISSEAEAGSKPARLDYHVHQYLPAWTWLEIHLHTGRTHQIRVQCAARSHPVLGDEQYGASRPLVDASVDRRQRPIALHARSLSFQHPKSHEQVSIQAPLPPLWQTLLEAEAAREGEAGEARVEP